MGDAITFCRQFGDGFGQSEDDDLERFENDSRTIWDDSRTIRTIRGGFGRRSETESGMRGRSEDNARTIPGQLEDDATAQAQCVDNSSTMPGRSENDSRKDAEPAEVG